jgi:hypothetical protein
MDATAGAEDELGVLNLNVRFWHIASLGAAQRCVWFRG